LHSRDAAVKGMDSTDCSGASQQSSGVALTRSLRKDRPGAAAGRMFAQALGLPHTSQLVADSSTDGMKLIQNESKGGKKSLTNPNVMSIAEDSITLVHQSIVVESASKTSEKRGRREKHRSLDPSKLEVFLQEDLRKGNGRGHQLEKTHLRSKKHLFQEDHETGELFLTCNKM